MAAAVPVEVPDATVGFDFRELRPTKCQKEYMIERIVKRHESAASIAKRCHINRKYLNILVHRRGKGMSVNRNCGRPRLLDTESCELICASFGDFQSESIPQLKEAIDIEARATYDRRYAPLLNMIENDDIEVSVSKRSFKRYIIQLLPGIFLLPNPIQQNEA